MCGHAVGRANCNWRATSRRRPLGPPDRRDREVERRRRMPEATIVNLRTDFESVEEELRQISSNEQNRQQIMLSGHQRIAAANPSAPNAESGQ